MGEAAKIVLGQPDFVTSSGGNAINRFGPAGLALDTHLGGIWVSDGSNTRVMHFPAPLQTNMESDIILTGPMAEARSIAMDLSGGIWVVSGTTATNGNSVLHFPAGMNSGTSFDIRLGTGTSGSGQNTLSNPFGVAVDANDGVWVSDYFNSRVMHYSPPFSSGMNADLVLGVATFSAGGGPASISTLGAPMAVGVDPSGNVWVADSGNNRVLQFKPPFTNGMNADLVLGQPDFVTSTSPSTPNKQNLMSPRGFAFAANGAVWVSDGGNTRAVRYSPPFTNGMAADNVLGQPDFISKNTTMAISAKVTNNTNGIAIDPCGVWVVDSPNNRVLFFP
ncbi:NHL repeat-containing protein [Leptospira sarikeiensis]|nr:NHL repeat-containing protein [Leptospira sarikeiensis]